MAGLPHTAWPHATHCRAPRLTPPTAALASVRGARTPHAAGQLYACVAGLTPHTASLGDDRPLAAHRRAHATLQGPPPPCPRFHTSRLSAICPQAHACSTLPSPCASQLTVGCTTHTAAGCRSAVPARTQITADTFLSCGTERVSCIRRPVRRLSVCMCEFVAKHARYARIDLRAVLLCAHTCVCTMKL
jgi:hypothetical protein